MPSETFTPRPRATLRRGPTGAIIAASIKVHRRPGESAAAFQCRLQRDFGAVMEAHREDEPLAPMPEGDFGGETPSIPTAPVCKVEGWIRNGFNAIQGARLRTLGPNGRSFEVMMRGMDEIGGLYGFLNRLQAEHNALIPQDAFTEALARFACTEDEP